MKQLLTLAVIAIIFASCQTLPKGLSLTGDSNCAQVQIKIPSKPPVTVYYCDSTNINKVERMIKEAIQKHVK